MGEALSFFQVGAVNIPVANNQVDIQFGLPVKDIVFIKSVTIGGHCSDGPGVFHPISITGQLITSGPIPGLLTPLNPSTTAGTLESVAYPRFYSGFLWEGSIMVSGQNNYTLRARCLVPAAIGVALWNVSALIGFEKSNDEIALPHQNRTYGWKK